MVGFGYAGTLQHDDGVIVYVNGVRVAAFDDVACDDGGNSLGHGFDANLQYGGANASTPKTDTFTLTDLSMLKEGENTIAVELHNGRRTSSDVWFHFTGLSLSAEAIQVDFSDLSLSVGADDQAIRRRLFGRTLRSGGGIGDHRPRPPGIRIGTNIIRCTGCQLFQERLQLTGTE